MEFSITLIEIVAGTQKKILNRHNIEITIKLIGVKIIILN